MQPETNQELFPLADLLACVAREVAMRKSCYPKWDKVTSLDALSPGRKRELAMMTTVGERLTELNQACLDFDKKVDALQAFKDYVHTTLDTAGVDKHEEQNAINGCRIGARLADLIKAAATPAPLADAELAYIAHPGNDASLALAIEVLELHSVPDATKTVKAVRAALPGLLARLAAAEAKASLLDSMQDTNRVLTERLQAAATVLEGYEQWEANVIKEDAAWSTPAAHPWQTDELYDEWMRLQEERNEVLRPTVKGGQPHA